MKLFKNFNILLITQGKTGCYVVLIKNYILFQLCLNSQKILLDVVMFLTLFGLAIITKNFDIVDLL